MKPWNEELKQHISQWSAMLGQRSWWPKFAYHFTDVRNAAEVIRAGALYSRAEATRLGLMQVDNASPVVIGHTAASTQRFVRLYFRPRTPTQYRNEGIRPVARRSLHAHCAVPVFFCFDAFKILARDDSLFSNGNMASPDAQFGDSLELFRQIPFGKVFHYGPYDTSQSRDIVFHRNAEILVPEKLDLAQSLGFVACRSIAERETLLNLLPADYQTIWNPIVRYGIDGLFERRWSYVEQVNTVNSDELHLTLNPNSETYGPFAVRLDYEDSVTKVKLKWSGQVADVRKKLSFRLKNASEGIVTVHLDDALAFRGRVTFEAIPF
jgi:hypothetical protein